jgi:hypothetical protein
MNAEEAVLSYFRYRKIENIGYLKYGNYKKIISFVLDCHNDYYIRKLFLSLVDKNYLIKKKNIKKSYAYIFNPNPEVIKFEKPLDINYFTVTWD